MNARPAAKHEPTHAHAHAGDCCGGGRRTGSAGTLAKDPVCGMSVDPHTAKHRAEHGGRTYYFCSAGCRAKFVADPAQVPAPRPRRRPSRSPRARSTPARCTRRSARSARAPARSAAWRWSRSNPAADTVPNPELIDMQRRFWIGAGADAAGVRARDGRPPVRLASLLIPAHAVELDAARAGDAGRAVGRLAVLRARLASLGADAQPQHVHADRARHRRGLRLQRGRDAAARHLPRGASAATTARCRSTSRPPRSSPCWCCSARCWSCARESDRRRHPRAARPRAEDGAAHRCRRRARGRPARRGRRRRPPARAAGREGARRRQGRRRPQRGR